MLVLVAVTISLAVNGGLFEKAGQAVGETQNAVNEEQEISNGRIKIGDVWYDSIDDYLTSKQGVTATEVHNNLENYLGKTVYYGVPYSDESTYGNEEWELFYADERHIYLITKGNLAFSKLSASEYNGTSDFTTENLASKYPAVAAGLLDKTYDPTAAGTEDDPYLKYSSSYGNMKKTQYLLDSTKWSSYVDGNLADWAIGAPTFELFIKSYNAFYKTSIELSTPTSYGYDNPLSDSNSVPTGTYLNHAGATYYGESTYTTYFWLACPGNYYYCGTDAARVDGKDGRVFLYVDALSALRPVVCLKSNVKLSWDSTNNQFDLIP